VTSSSSTNIPPPELRSLWSALADSGEPIESSFCGAEATVPLASLAHASSLGGALDGLRGRSVLLAARDQLTAALALVELDGVAGRIVLCTPDLSREHLQRVAEIAATDALVLDAGAAAAWAPDLPARALASPALTPRRGPRSVSHTTEWVLLTSGTTGAPKLVLHTLASLSGALPRQPIGAGPSVWSTFYDIRRYGGLQIFLRAVLGGRSLVLSSPDEGVRDFLGRAAAAGVTHISGTPSHWRKALMSGSASLLDPRYVRLSGEIADQALLDRLHAAYPRAGVAHAFASTEAGVAFDVADGLAGFPADLVGRRGAAVDLKVEDGTLRIRSGRNAARYLGAAAAPLHGDDGYVDTGDLVELRSGRYHFVGRRGGVINVGGQKVYPEEVEAVINTDPRVRMSLVRARRSPITGAVVIADVVLTDEAAAADEGALTAAKAEILDACRDGLQPHKVPTMLRFVPALELTPAGKLVRPGA
jgi:acyl-coenzyme A synthetase/AMP-(fatty) acid ligase